MSQMLEPPQHSGAIDIDLAALNIDALIAQFDAAPSSAPAQHDTGAVQEVQPEVGDRRASPRLTEDQLVVNLRLSLAGGDGATLLNISSSGVLLDTSRRLCPGQTVDLFLRRNDERHALRGVVVRCHLKALAPGTFYRAAIRFDRALTIADFAR